MSDPKREWQASDELNRGRSRPATRRRGLR